MNNHFDTLLPLLRLKSNLEDPRKFHEIVNVIFHDVEAKYYDHLHEEMWQSLPAQYRLIFNDLKPHLVAKNNLKLLDIGCGTGLATEMLLNTDFNKLVTEVTLLDTSPAMLYKAQKRSKRWRKKITLAKSEIGNLTGKFDVMIISSVLHHIPDLKKFLQKVDDLQAEGGILITIHDPSSEAMQNEVYLGRCREFAHSKQSPKPTLAGRIVNKIKRMTKPLSYIDEVNTLLLKQAIIHQPLTAQEIWSITDIHVEGLPYSINDGVSRQMLQSTLLSYQLISYRTYDFFGTPVSNLTEVYQKKEQELSLAGDLNGRNFSSLWIKNNK